MKKFTLLAGALAIAASLNAETTTLDASTLTFDANAAIAGEVITLDSHISITTAAGETTDETKVPLYRKASTSNGTLACIQLYSKNTLTVTATDATITKVTFTADESEKGTPSWSITAADKTTLSSSANSWECSTASTTFTDKSAARIAKIEVEYTPAGNGSNETGDSEDAETTLIVFSDDLYDTNSTANAQDYTLEEGGITVNLKSSSTSAKFSKNTCYFGTADSYQKFTCRWQSGTKSTSTNGTYATASIPAKGTLEVYARSASTTEDRAIVLTQNGTELVNKTLSESDAVADETAERSYFPVVSTGVAKGTVTITWPTNGINIYGFKYVPDEELTGVVEMVVVPESGETIVYNLNGRRVPVDTKGLVIVNGKKIFRK
jgi:hypothetical protein